MIVGKKAAFRLKLTDVESKKSKTVTIYKGKEKKSLERVVSDIVEFLRTKE